MMYAISLALVLFLTRVLESPGHHVVRSWWSPVAYLWHDAAVVLAFAAFEVACRRRRWLVWTVYIAVATYAILNIPIDRALSSPLTLAMWRAAGGPLADSIRHYATWPNAAAIAVGFAAVLLAPRWSRKVPARPVMVALVVCVACGPAAAARVDTQGRERNAWTALAGSLLPPRTAAAAPRDWRASAIAMPRGEDLTATRGAARGRNVILVSLESTGSRYLGLYGAPEDVAPNLSDLSRSALVFDNAYAVYPESIKGLFSILCSATPAFDSDAESYGWMPCRSIAAVLHDQGYRTGLFHSGRFGYLGMDAVVRSRGYDVLADAGDIGGAHDSSFGIDEPSTVASVLRWIDSAPAGRPFFVTYLPIAGHHPYETPERGPFPDRDEFGRYRNALHYGDAALGALRRGLQARGLDRNTLWIVLGDHGEAFGQHDGNYGHTFQLYDENVHVPYVIAAPGLLSQSTRIRRVVSLIDTAPTLVDLLGVPAPPAYEGRSMLDAGNRAALFFTDYSLPLVGLRDGPRKIIHDLRSGRSRWFDLEHDPAETTDLSSRHPAETKRYEALLEGWISSARSPVIRRYHAG
jgi:glucan phosphoethanolaminetransferase (alkaline phosphatase superfamily)